MSILDLLDKVTLAGVATTVALVLSVVTFWRQEVGKRAAALTVTCEEIPGRISEHYVLVHNAGPAQARDVTVRFLEDEDNASPVEGGRPLEPLSVFIPAGHTARLQYVRSYQSWSNNLEVTWRDKRRGSHELVAPVNIVKGPGSPVVNVNVEPVSMDDIAKGVARRFGQSGRH